MADNAMFASFPTGDDAAAPPDAAGRSKPVPIVPVPADAPKCTWRHPKRGAPVAMWPYQDAESRLVGYAARVEFVGADGERQKDVLPITYCRLDQGGHRHAWRARALPAPRPLYRLPELIANPMAPVMVVEGEKKADIVPALFTGWRGTTSIGGASAAKFSDWAPLAGRRVIVWPDHDEPGRRYAGDVAALATAAGAASVAIVAVPAEWLRGWDIADPLPEGAAPDELAGPLHSAIPWAPPAPNQPSGEVDSTAEIARLAGLPRIEYGRERKPAAQRLGCPVAILDQAVAAERTNGGAVAGQGRPLDLHEPEPWPESVEGAALLNTLAAAVRRHVVIGGAEADAAALWVLAVHAFDAFAIFPRLFVTAPEKQCGKSTLLDVLSRLVPKPLGASGITAAALFRIIEAARPTLLLDEADSYARDNEDLRGVLDAGHRRDGVVIRTVGEDHEPRQFSAWAPVALAAIGHLPGTIEDRSIRIELRRRRPDEPLEPLRLDRAGRLEELARMAARWAADHATELAAADPAMPAGIYNRAADNWRPPLAVADLAGSPWPERARRAAIELTGDGDDQSSIRVPLLADIRAAFAAKGVDRLSSDELASYLSGLDDRPWPEYRAGKPISKAQVAHLLKPLKVSSGTIRLPDGSTPKGYYLAAFRDPFARYLPAENATTPQPQHFRSFGANFKTLHGKGCGVSEAPETPSVSAACGVVAVCEPGADDGEFEECAAILEYDGGHPRAEAERRARAELAGRREKNWLQ
jgi:Protein of unknown function (DUF3631)